MLFSKLKSQLGVDIGTSNIKLVQLLPKDQRFVLETYGLVNMAYPISGKDSKKVISQTGDILKSLIEKSGVTTKDVIASLPNSVVFTSVIEMPRIPEDEVRSAIQFEAKKYVPMPLEEIALSWSVIEDKKKLGKDAPISGIGPDNSKMKILLTAVPTMVVDNYLSVFKEAGLNPIALEIEALALIRSLVGEDQNSILMIDIGSKNTSINIVDAGYLRLSKNLTVGGDTVTLSIAHSLNVNFARAEQFKKDFGLAQAASHLPQVMRPILDVIKSEAMQLINLYESRGERIDKIILCGGGSKLPNLQDYFSGLGKPITLANPWSKIVFSQELKPIIEPLGLNLAVAMGLAMRKV